MDTNALKKFAQSARNLLIDQVTARLNMVLAEGAAARREHPKAIAKLEAAANNNRGQVIEQAAYTWFNRFTALRFMDVTGLTNPRVVSPADGATRPEILAEAMAGNLPDRARPEIVEYLNGTRPAHDGQAEAYRLLLIHACNEWHGAMPYMFERADMLDRAEDYTELLIPDDLLSPDSILARLREVMTEDACQDVEIIGWLYQFYISEKKDQVFAGLKKNQKITAENIPAATQLFTPHWIVRYLVENSLGRLWLLNRPQSKLAAKMDYYIAPEEPETDFLRITRPEDIRICDPACGSGHMLTYAFDLLYEIYAEEGHDSAEIPGLILKHNLTGIEIDDRAGALAAFALSMKASARLGRRRFLRMEERPGIVVLQNVTFTPAEMQDVAAVVGKDLFTDELRETLGQFEQAKNFGSLIIPKLRDPAETLRVVEARDFGSDLLLKEVQARVVAVLRMAEALSPKYHVVVANPPYGGAKGLNDALNRFGKSNFPNSKNDLYAMFMERVLGMTRPHGSMAMVNMQSWMFLSRYEAMRSDILSNGTILTMAHLGERAFDTIGGAVVSTTAFILKRIYRPDFKGSFLRLTEGASEAEKARLARETISQRTLNWHTACSRDFETFPGNPIAYWATQKFLQAYRAGEKLGDISETAVGLFTCDNERFLRYWHEVSDTDTDRVNEQLEQTKAKYYPYNKGGGFRRWYGLNELVVFFQDEGIEIRDHRKNSGQSWSLPGERYYFREGITWSGLTSDANSFRWSDKGFVFESNKGQMLFSNQNHELLPFLNSKVCAEIVSLINPTLSLQSNEVKKISYTRPSGAQVGKICEQLVKLSRSDWDAYETSWDFTKLPLLSPDHRAGTLEATYARLRAHWQSMTDEMQRLEQENNRIFIDAYGLADELTPEVPIEEITLTCNPAYRYGVKGSEEDREARLREDTVAELLHYAVGCMFGRYSLDAPGLILANQGEGIEDYLARVPEPTFAPDRDNVIPVLDADWFADDIVTRARDFLRVTFGEAKFRENLAFVEAALGKDLRKWFTRDFFDYHVRRYKKRPIYWMFSSPKGSFNALIYMHRYRSDTVSVVLNQYVREFIHKLEVERTRLEKLAVDPAATPAQQTKAQKETATVIKQLAELTEWERDVVYPMAQQKIAIDLDDGVKRNYPLFAGALKPIKGLEAADD
ncbi:BREX-1 system adenine-specific DNA-methyltransferase PglX [Mesorhizobium sp. ES1-1]|uniref:BREX-1 system adenine-specific DNA-methyltransferase PglX n=1 Tax=Mesorhizobium sp. ES1-1 TaxID=2876629 RepID=UPI000876728E|nr:BREX-1 system adenine-specific DNA-methyltransferase PglX [Mesorhizobium sp. ES1-1]MBZ9678560.1 BREX-1 system adenine-specific DNA-methyltransferase PglX [Mesorhizobium sp. ES1-1]SCW83468.1 Methyltransferase domain-containing protein [Sphingobium faniae]